MNNNLNNKFQLRIVENKYNEQIGGDNNYDNLECDEIIDTQLNMNELNDIIKYVLNNNSNINRKIFKKDIKYINDTYLIDNFEIDEEQYIDFNITSSIENNKYIIYIKKLETNNKNIVFVNSSENCNVTFYIDELIINNVIICFNNIDVFINTQTNNNGGIIFMNNNVTINNSNSLDNIIQQNSNITLTNKHREFTNNNTMFGNYNNLSLTNINYIDNIEQVGGMNMAYIISIFMLLISSIQANYSYNYQNKSDLFNKEMTNMYNQVNPLLITTDASGQNGITSDLSFLGVNSQNSFFSTNDNYVNIRKSVIDIEGPLNVNGTDKFINMLNVQSIEKLDLTINNGHLYFFNIRPNIFNDLKELINLGNNATASFVKSTNTEYPERISNNPKISKLLLPNDVSTFLNTSESSFLTLEGPSNENTSKLINALKQQRSYDLKNYFKNMLVKNKILEEGPNIEINFYMPHILNYFIYNYIALNDELKEQLFLYINNLDDRQKERMFESFKISMGVMNKLDKLYSGDNIHILFALNDIFFQKFFGIKIFDGTNSSFTLLKPDGIIKTYTGYQILDTEEQQKDHEQQRLQGLPVPTTTNTTNTPVSPGLQPIVLSPPTKTAVKSTKKGHYINKLNEIIKKLSDNNNGRNRDDRKKIIGPIKVLVNYIRNQTGGSIDKLNHYINTYLISIIGNDKKSIYDKGIRLINIETDNNIKNRNIELYIEGIEIFFKYKEINYEYSIKTKTSTATYYEEEKEEEEKEQKILVPGLNTMNVLRYEQPNPQNMLYIHDNQNDTFNSYYNQPVYPNLQHNQIMDHSTGDNINFYNYGY